jgi:cephalosporin hydroxylase
LEASVAAYARQWQTLPGLVKVQEDLDRYERIIEDTKPEVIVECGTWTGASAAWFAEHGVEVLTIDVDGSNRQHIPDHLNVGWIEGSTVDPDVVEQVVKRVDGRRCMVVLDSDHSAPHVLAELNAYADLVSPGCFLVVEDTICRWVEGTPVTDLGPLDAVEQFFPNNPEWVYDEAIHDLFPVSHHPFGWWRKR